MAPDNSVLGDGSLNLAQAMHSTGWHALLCAGQLVRIHCAIAACALQHTQRIMDTQPGACSISWQVPHAAAPRVTAASYAWHSRALGLASSSMYTHVLAIATAWLHHQRVVQQFFVCGAAKLPLNPRPPASACPLQPKPHVHLQHHGISSQKKTR